MLTAEDWTVVKSLFAGAMELSSQERSAWLRSQGSVPPAVLEEVERLLQGQQSVKKQPEAPSKAKPTFSQDSLVLSRFSIRRLLGRGGMGEVYLAWDRVLEQHVALKTVSSEHIGDALFSTRLEQEIRAARRVQHENVCKLYDLHYEEALGLTFLTMEFLDGPTLSERLREGALTVPEVEQLAEQLAKGLDAIHAAGIVHRDLKPSNLFLLPRAVLADFGLAFDVGRPVTETLTNFGPTAIVGTPSYMAPEQLLGHKTGFRADIHAFGAVLFEAFSGRRAFTGETPLAVALRRLSDEALPTDPSIPKGWMRAIHCCLERDAEKRPATAAEVLQIARSKPRGAISRRALVVSGGVILAVSAVGVGYKLSRPGAPRSAEATHHMKLGLEYAKRTTNRELLTAIREFEQAVKLAPDFAEAWAHLSDSYCAAANHVALPRSEARPKAESAARQALKLDPAQGLAHASLAYVLSTDFDRWAQAGEFFQRAISKSPKEPVIRSRYAGYLGRRKRFEEAVLMARSAVALEPGQFRFQMQLAAELFRARRFPELLAHMQGVVEMHATHADGYLTLCRAFEKTGKFAEAEGALSTAERLFSETDMTAYRASLRSAQGRFVEARRLADQYLQGWRLGKHESNTTAGVEGSLGRTDNVFSIIEEALARPDDTVLAIPSNPYLAYLDQDPRMQRICRRLDLPA